MNLKDLSKEQKQYIALGLLSAAIVVILMALGIRISMATISTAKEELDGLTDKINRANRALSQSKQISEEYVETIDVLKKYLENAPPERNYYSWATEVIYSKARHAGLEIDSIDEIIIPQPRRQGPEAAAATISFESYSLRVMGHGGYENTKYFINLLKQDYPLVRFSGVEISSGQNPEEHDVQVFMQWPFNFSEITRNWDAVANTQMKIAAANDNHEVADPTEPEPVHQPLNSVTSVIKPDPVREPHPPVTRPDREEAPAPDLAVEQAAAKTQPLLNDGLQMESSSVDVAPKPATRDEIQAILSGAVPQAVEQTDEDAQYETTESKPVLDTPSVVEPKTVASEPIPVVKPGIEYGPNPNPVPDSPVEQEIGELIGALEATDTSPIRSESASDALEAAPQTDSVPPSLSGGGSAPEVSVDLQAALLSDAPYNDVSAQKSEKIPEELLKEGGARQDTTFSSFLNGLVGEINDK